MQKWIILLIIAVIAIIGIFIVLNVNIETEYVPESEVSETEFRNTIVTLYFQDGETKELVKENRLIDSKNLLKDPYKELLNLLMTGPENEGYKKCIPDGTEIIDVAYENETVIINFSKEFVENNGEEKQKYNSVYSIVNTLTELNEVSKIKFIVDGKEIDGFTGIGLDFKQVFSRVN
ncbi:MAG: GerMN domain-containing protein [Clostridia bacterium]|nr:GerMN domain-containing protein [Clostridia bacterium]